RAGDFRARTSTISRLLHVGAIARRRERRLLATWPGPARLNMKGGRMGGGGTRMRRVAAWIIGAAACGIGVSAAAQGQDDPARPVRVIVGFGAGSGADITARVVGARMSEILGQQIVVENKTGAGSSIGADYVAHQSPDGYTLFMATISQPINAAVSPHLNFNFAKDFTPIVRVSTTANLLVVNPSLGVKTVQELIALGKAKPDSLAFGSSGVATRTHLAH